MFVPKPLEKFSRAETCSEWDSEGLLQAVVLRIHGRGPGAGAGRPIRKPVKRPSAQLPGALFKIRVYRPIFTNVKMHPLMLLNGQKQRWEKHKITWVHLKWNDGILERKNIQGTRANCWNWKVQRSLKFIFHISSLSSRSKVLVFVWLIHGAARWPHMVGRPLFYEPALPAVLLRGSDFLFTLPVLSSLLSAAWGKKENFDLGFSGDAANFGWPNYKISVFSLYQRLYKIKKKKKRFPRK